MSEFTWETKITKIEPNKLTVRGHKLDELIGKAKYSDMVYLLLKGNFPNQEVSNIFEAILVSSVDHGVTPPSTIAARTSASSGAPINAALAAGILTINKHHGGAIENCMNTLINIKNITKGNDLKLEEYIQKLVKENRANKIRFSGFGHRIHTDDPRTKKLFEIAEKNNICKTYFQIIRCLEITIEKEYGKKLPINVDGAIAAILCELDFNSKLANAFFIISRLPGLCAHIQEEYSMKPMRTIVPKEAEYTGK
ncbi:MAG: citryl-CoA lyase [Pseudomonadota bacterium]